MASCLAVVRTLGRWTLVSVAIATLAFSAKAESLVLGQTLSLTGPAGNIGQALAHGRQACTDYLNAQGGISGASLRLITLDDGGDSQRAMQNLRVLVEQEKISVLLGPMGAAVNQPVLQATQAAGLAVVGPFGSDVGSRTAKPEGVFFVTASQSAEAERLASHVSALNLKRVAIVHSADAGGQAALVALEEGLYGVNTPPIASLAVSASGGGAQIAVASIRDAQPQAVLLATTGRATTEVLRALAVNSTGLLQIYGLSSSASVGDLGRTGIGYSMVQVLPSPKNSKLPIAATFRQAIAKGEKEPSYVQMEGCLAVLALGEALKRKGDTSRATVWRTLKATGTLNVGGLSIDFSDPVQGTRFTDIVYFGPDGRLVR